MAVDTDAARKAMEDSGIIVYPTETAYGIGANALDEGPIEKVYEVKKRPCEKGLTVICSSLEQVERYSSLGELERKLVDELMPGPLTLVAEKKDNVPDNLNEKFVFRISSSRIARELASDFPLVATSANVSGGETSYSVEDIDDSILAQVDAVLEAGELDRSPTSTIAEVNNGEIVIHRKGPVSRQELEKVLADGDRY